MFKDFVVKVNRYWDDENGNQGWNGWFYSKVFAIKGNQFLVYDDGMLDAFNGEDDYCEAGYMWVDFTETIPKIGNKGYEMRVEPYEADTPQTKNCPWCNATVSETDKYCHECGWYLGKGE